MLLNEMESLKASKELGDFAISAAPGEGANPRAHELSATEKSLSLALTAALAASILDPELFDFALGPTSRQNIKRSTLRFTPQPICSLPLSRWRPASRCDTASRGGCSRGPSPAR